MLRTCLAIAVLGLCALALPRAASANTFYCKPVQAADFPGSRIHVRCQPGDGAIQYFSVSTANQEDANRVLSLVATALATNRQLFIFYNAADTSGAAFGCLAADCRIIQGIELL